MKTQIGTSSASVAVSVNIKGMKELQKLLKKMPSEAQDAALHQFKVDLLVLQGKAQDLAPYDLGDLRGSAFSDAVKTLKGVEGEVGFNEDYALRQHETHKTNKKYLENPLKENINKYIDNLGNAIKKAVDKSI